jgi:hypothetical protein
MQTVALQSQAAAEATVFAVRQDEAADEPTHSRVIEHTEQLVGEDDVSVAMLCSTAMFLSFCREPACSTTSSCHDEGFNRVCDWLL